MKYVLSLLIGGIFWYNKYVIFSFIEGTIEKYQQINIVD